MPSKEPFTFGIALIPRSSADNWPLVEALLELTLASVLAQTDPDFRVIIAGHDRPAAADRDARIGFVRADWPAAPPRADNLDCWRKKHAINDLVLASGGGLLMLLDADDWVDRRLVEVARAGIRPEHVGGLIEHGFATDARTLRASALPRPGILAGAFYQVCGSCSVVRVRPSENDPCRRDPYKVLHDHHRWPEMARERGLELARLGAIGNYLVNTSENHSERHGPFVAWRRRFTAAVNRHGAPIDDAFAARFGLDLDRIAALSSGFFGRGRGGPGSVRPAGTRPGASGSPRQ